MRVRIQKYAHFIAFFTLVIALTFGHRTYGQIIELGFKAGTHASWFRYDDAAFRKQVKVKAILGYSIGPVVSFKVRDRYFLHTEYLFSTKGRKIKGIEDPLLDDRLVNSFIEIPITYNILFKGHLMLGSDKRFKYFAGAGPLFSYWLAGRGKVYSDSHAEANFSREPYKVVFGVRHPDNQDRNEVYINTANRLQLGFIFGGGLMTEPDAKHRIMIDLRYEYGHTWMAKEGYEDFRFPNDQVIQISNKARSMGLRLSAMYMIEQNTNKKVRNRGKSTIKKKHKR